MIEGLPYNTHLRQAQLNDEEYVAQLLEAEEQAKRNGQDTGSDKPQGVPVSEWSREVEVTTSLGQDVRNLTAVVQAAFGNKKAPPAYAGPSTIVKRAQYARRKQQHETLVRRLLPHKAQEE